MTRDTSHSTLLIIAEAIAMSDGSVSEEEAQLIKDLQEYLGLDTVPRLNNQQLPSLTKLADQLETEGDRCLAARIAGLIAASSRNPGDQQDINLKERTAYRELIAALNLTSEQLQEIEWCVREDLRKEKSLLQIIGAILLGKTGWPDLELLNEQSSIRNCAS